MRSAYIRGTPPDFALTFYSMIYLHASADNLPLILHSSVSVSDVATHTINIVLTYLRMKTSDDLSVMYSIFTWMGNNNIVKVSLITLMPLDFLHLG